jgi:hypothetical protein
MEILEATLELAAANVLEDEPLGCRDLSESLRGDRALAVVGLTFLGSVRDAQLASGSDQISDQLLRLQQLSFSPWTLRRGGHGVPRSGFPSGPSRSS